MPSPTRWAAIATRCTTLCSHSGLASAGAQAWVFRDAFVLSHTQPRKRGALRGGEYENTDLALSPNMVAMGIKEIKLTDEDDYPVIESVLVKFTSGPNEAWGEACTLGAPTYSPEHAAGIFCVLKEHFVDLVIGKEFDTSDDLQHALRWFKGNQFAKVVLPAATAAAAGPTACLP